MSTEVCALLHLCDFVWTIKSPSNSVPFYHSVVFIDRCWQFERNSQTHSFIQTNFNVFHFQHVSSSQIVKKHWSNTKKHLINTFCAHLLTEREIEREREREWEEEGVGREREGGGGWGKERQRQRDRKKRGKSDRKKRDSSVRHRDRQTLRQTQPARQPDRQTGQTAR